ncbi:unnamed protein product [Zymoseptoria tritici ST99CH_3D7]|uniref:Uncharacterized protein n=1 Tax=Zymoseptoria tritici (strain ST99CH_3D7) TaxID=1276538 RepID=A0A1X7RU25_ZYMT9|nr:unnamed protein product [Zymoseptoria tritici ST99CH_3D7]
MLIRSTRDGPSPHDSTFFCPLRITLTNEARPFRQGSFNLVFGVLRPSSSQSPRRLSEASTMSLTSTRS